MRKSDKINETYYRWEGNKGLDDVVLEILGSKLELSSPRDREIKAFWEDFIKKHPEAYNGQLWRLESVLENSKLRIAVSATDYQIHAALMNETLPLESYPNPIGINALQETSDGYLLMGDRGKINALGAGFIDMQEDGLSLKAAFLREHNEETTYADTSFFSHEKFWRSVNALAISHCEEHDNGVILPSLIPLTHKEVGLKGKEHRELVLIPNRTALLQGIIFTGLFKGKRLYNQTLATLEQYLRGREAGIARSEYVHS